MYIEPRPCFDEIALYWLSVSSGVKITQRGFFYYTRPIVHAGESFACPRRLGALCNHTDTVFLPCTGEPLIPVADVPPPFDQFWRWETACRKRPTLSSEYHVTPCDLQNGAMLLWADGRLSVQYDLELPYWPGLALLLIVAWLVISMGESIALVLEVEGTRAQNHSTACLCLAFVAIVLAFTPEGMWATQEERVVHGLVAGYIIAYSLYHIHNTNTINVVAGCLILISSRMYQGHETPYVAGLLFLILTRLVQKTVLAVTTGGGVGAAADDAALWSKRARLCFMGLDLALAVVYYLYVFEPSVQDPLQAQLYMVGLLFISVGLGVLIGVRVREARLRKEGVVVGAKGAKPS
jgi:hypothetical protein